MASFYASLHVAGHSYSLRRCSYGFTQATTNRGQPSARVRHGKIEMMLDVPLNHFLEQWAAISYKPLPGYIVFKDAANGRILETLSWESGHCVSYQEVFTAGSDAEGAYICLVTIASPKLTLIVGGLPTPFVSPAAREHGLPPAASSPALPPAGTVSTCPPDVTARLQAQVALTCRAKGVSMRCTEPNSCAELLEKIALTKACIAARETIMNQCFGGGDAEHQEELRRRKEGLRRCEAIYLKQCRPLQQPVPVPQPAPDTEPAPHKSNPAVPVGLTGLALLLYYLMLSLEALAL